MTENGNQLQSTGNPHLDELLQIMIRRFEYLVSKGFLNPDFLSRILESPDEIIKFLRQNRSLVGKEINNRLSYRPSYADLEQMSHMPIGYCAHGHEIYKYLKMFNNSHNVNGTDQNMMHLVRGFYNESREKSNLKTIPDDVIHSILSFIISLCAMYEKDTFRRNNKQLQLKGSRCENWLRKQWKIKIVDHEPNECIDFDIGVIGARKKDKPLTVGVKDLNMQIGDVLSMLYSISYDSDGIALARLTFAVNNTKTKKISVSEIEPSPYRLYIVLKKKNHTKIELLY